MAFGFSILQRETLRHNGTLKPGLDRTFQRVESDYDDMLTYSRSSL